MKTNLCRRFSFIYPELLAGFTSFLTMAYIAFINPAILSEAGMAADAVFTATCLVSAFACACIGFYAKSPIAIAPGMALNIYFTYSVVQTLGFDWPHALAMVFISGVLFLMVSVTRLRKLLTNAIPPTIQLAILLGISLLMGLIALQTNHIIVGGQHTLMHMGSLINLKSGLFFLGFFLILTLDYYRIPGAIIIGILTISALSLLFGLTSWHGVFSLPPSLNATFFKLDFSGMRDLMALKATFSFFLITVFDATGTLIGLLNQPSLKQQPHYHQRLQRGLIADALASIVASLLGSASTSPFIESAAGIKAGGRTGLTAITIAVCFLLLLFFFPLAQTIPNFASGPALLYVACCMMSQARELSFKTVTESAPCFLIMMMIPFTGSIADGMGCGIILHTALKLATRQKVNALLALLSVIFFLFFLVS